MNMFDLPSVQKALRDFQFDGWLLYDFRGSNVPARRILQVPDNITTSRRYYYFIPAEGRPHKIVNRIEHPKSQCASKI